MHSKLLFLLASFFVATVSCNKEQSTEMGKEPGEGTLLLSFTHSVRSQALNFTDQYANNWGETYTVSRLKYYVHDIRLLDSNGNATLLSDGYFLVDEEVPGSKQISVVAPAGQYASLVFTLGVDSIHNVSGAQTGALDPAHGMFWTWSSGYIMAKLEGHSDHSTHAGKVFTYHIGGFKEPHVTMKTIKLPFAANPVVIAKDTLLTATINADIDAWFSGVHELRIANDPACHAPGELAKKIADNYEGMFSLTSIE